MERKLTGIPASPGIAVGPIRLLRWEIPEVKHRIVSDDAIPAEIRRLHDAIDRAKQRLTQIKKRVEKSAGTEESQIFDVQCSILEDQSLISAIEALIKQNLAAEKAFEIVLYEWQQNFARSQSAMLRERVGDLKDVEIRVLTLLLDLPDHDPVDVPKGANAILVTHDLTPSLTVQLDREAIAAIATDAGTRTSHVAILARSLGLPAVVGLRTATDELVVGQRVILDGSAGVIVVNPSDEDVRYWQARARREAEEEEELRGLAAAEAITLDGERVTIRANVDLPEEAEHAAHSGAEGVGLMRTEFLVVGRANMPDEEEQYRAYRRVVEAFPGRPVVVRTFDIGGDKLPVGGYPTEANPFLGWRAIRMCLDQPELFRTQLRAMLRAAAHGDLRILLPLIVTVDEVKATRALIDQAIGELEARGAVFRKDVLLGAMIETPAAALGADKLAGAVQFFSIGTNDLVQYTLAVDRGNANLAARFTPLHPAVLRLIRNTVEVGQATGVSVSVCGEMASHPVMAWALLGLGIRELSVNPRAVAHIKRALRSVSAADARDAADAALAAPTAAQAEALLAQRLRDALGDLLPADGLPAL